MQNVKIMYDSKLSFIYLFVKLFKMGNHLKRSK